jgi:hypothetical protein
MEPAVHSGGFRLIWFFRLPKGEITCQLPLQVLPNPSPPFLQYSFLSDSVSHSVFPTSERVLSFILQVLVQIAAVPDFQTIRHFPTARFGFNIALPVLRCICFHWLEINPCAEFV